MEISNFIYNFIQGNSNIDYIEFFGFRVYIDDLIILGLLYLLFKEECNDEFLFVVLIMLLLS